MEKRLTTILACSFLSCGIAMAQTQVQGTVISSEDGLPVVGASVIVAGTKTGTLTDVDGKFSLSVPSGAKLVISYLGMQQKTVNASGNLRISLDPDNKLLNEVVVTGTRNATDVRHLPMTVNVIGRQQLTEQHQTSVLPTVMQQVPGFFVTSRSMMGYGVSTGAAGGINLRGISGGAGQLLVLIDGHPQYQGIYGHPISDSYQTLMAERIRSGGRF